MTAKLTIALSDEVLEALRTSRSITIRVEASRGGGGGARRPVGPDGFEVPRDGSLPRRLIDWAETRTKPFGTKEVVRRFKLSRAHASMLLSRLANGPYPIARERRGVYIHQA